MTELEKSIVRQLGLSEHSAEMLIDEIRRYIVIARAELVRSGVSAYIAESDEPLVQMAIETFVLMNMSESNDVDRLDNSFKYQLDNLRKS